VFHSEEANALADALIEHLGVTPSVTSHDAEWLLGLLQHAVPSSPGNSEKDWEGGGRAYAEQLLTAVMDGREHPMETKLTKLGELLAQKMSGGAKIVRIDEILDIVT
jgi:hypothetical protein